MKLKNSPKIAVKVLTFHLTNFRSASGALLVGTSCRVGGRAR